MEDFAKIYVNTPSGYSKKNLNQMLLNLIQFSNVHNSHRASNAIQSYLEYKLHKISLDVGSFRIALLLELSKSVVA